MVNRFVNMSLVISFSTGMVFKTNASDFDRSLISHVVPPGAVMFFNLPRCPKGWRNFNAAKGRYVVGLTTDGGLRGTVGSPLTNLEERSSGVHNHPIGKNGSHDHSIKPNSGVITQSGSSNQISVEMEYGGLMFERNLVKIELDGMHDHPLYDSGVSVTNAPYIQLLSCEKE
jgi:hypothetical protein